MCGMRAINQKMRAINQKIGAPEAGRFRPTEVRTRPRPGCYLCGSKGEVLYDNLNDRLFSAPGEWSLRRCLDPRCGLVWLDPVPDERNIARLYEGYCTHWKPDQKYGGLKKFFIDLRRILALSLPLHYKRKRANLMYLDKVKPGRLLDVGCGDGTRLALLRAMGWKVEGQEIDPKAAARAHEVYKVKVHLGPLEEVGLPDDSFDAVIMNHVIEHVSDPISILAECRRILKPGGAFVAVTPNIDGFGHQHFGRHWLGLDPPRHLFLFSPTTLREVAARGGFDKFTVRTTALSTQGNVRASISIKRTGKYDMRSFPGLFKEIKPTFYQLWASAALVLNEAYGEECVLEAEK